MSPSDQPRSSTKLPAYLRWTLAASLMVVIAGPILFKAHRLSCQHEAVKVLRESGCNIRFDNKGGPCGFYDKSTRYQRLLVACGVSEPWGIYSLDASGSHVEDSQLWHLHGLAGLHWLSLGGRPITDQGLAQLAGLRDLETLSLWRTSITDDGLRHLQHLPHLDYLNLSETAITDYGLRYLQDSLQLKTLILNHTSVSDAGLVRLHELRGLKTLALSETRTTYEGIDKLTRILPNCEITYGVRMFDGSFAKAMRKGDGPQ